MALTNKLTAIADAIREKTGDTGLYTLDEMATAISGITGGGEGSGGGYNPTDEELTISGIFQYKFAYNSWNWIIDNYGDRITTKDLVNLMYGFRDNEKLTEIPFALNCKATTKNSFTNLFYGCKNLKNVPKMNNCYIESIDNIFGNCNSLREIPEDIDANWDWSAMETLTTAYSGNRASSLANCYSLRKFPMSFLNHGNPVANTSYSIYTSCFNSCYALDEIIGLPFPHLNATWTSNAFSTTFVQCNRLKNITFAVQEDGTPYTIDWKLQTIDLTTGIGNGSAKHFTDYNSGITADKIVSDEASYQALKNDPDWCSTIPEYSRYNHDSAVNTINSLPDTSAYINSVSANIIKFLGKAGSATDGGAINTLTEEEIAVAAAKGWTVTLV